MFVSNFYLFCFNLIPFSLSIDIPYYQDISHRSIYNDLTDFTNISPSWEVLPFALSTNKYVMTSINIDSNNVNCIVSLATDNKLFG